MTYANYFRHIDQHGVLHLATGTMALGSALCGTPPVGNEWG